MATTLAVNSRYSYFTNPPTNYQNITHSYTHSTPLTAPTPNTPITFNIDSNDGFINFSESKLRFKLKMIRAQSPHVRFAASTAAVEFLRLLQGGGAEEAKRARKAHHDEEDSEYRFFE